MTAFAVFESQIITVRTHTLLKETTCLYRVPNFRARSLSTLIAVRVIKDTPQKKGLFVLKRDKE